MSLEKHLTHSSTAKQEEKVKERGSCQPLINIPLRSMLINGGVPLLKDSQPYRRQPVTLICSSFIILLIASGY
jgi:hypothetical protein